jgi:hypothetical protein
MNDRAGIHDLPHQPNKAVQFIETDDFIDGSGNNTL